MANRRGVSRVNQKTVRSEVLDQKDFQHQISVDHFPVLMTVHDVAETLSVSRYVVHGMINEGQIASVKFGKRCVRVFRDSVKKYIEDQFDD